MEYTIRWKDMTEQPQTIKYFEEKIIKVFDFIFVEDNIKAEYVYYKKEMKYKLRLNVKVHKGDILRSEATDRDINHATLLCIDKMIDQLRKIKTKLNSNK